MMIRALITLLLGATFGAVSVRAEEPVLVPSEPVPAAPVRAEGLAPEAGMGALGGFGGSGGNAPGYSVTWYPAQAISGQAGDFGLVRQNLSLAAPVWRDGGDAVLLTGGVRNSLFFTDILLPDTHRPFPSELWKVNLGAIALHRFDNGWFGSLMVGVGSSSDQPFHALREMDANLGAFLRIPVREDRDAWMLGLMYSPSGTLNFPIPLVAYSWNPTDEFHLNIGLPLSLNWRPSDDWMLNLSYVPLTNVNARLTYRITEPFRVYIGYESLTESYYLADREETRDRFFAFEQRLVTGIRWNFWQHASLDLATGPSLWRRPQPGHEPPRRGPDQPRPVPQPQRSNQVLGEGTSLRSSTQFGEVKCRRQESNLHSLSGTSS